MTPANKPAPYAREIEAWCLRLVGRMTYARVANAMGVSVKEVKAMIRTAIAYVSGYSAGFDAAVKIRRGER